MDNYATGSPSRHSVGRQGIIGKSATQMIYGMTLRLPGDFTENYTIDANTDLEIYSDKLCMSRLQLSPQRNTNQKDMFV